MKRLGSGILTVILYCFPFVYFSMYQDFVNRSMFGYLIMIVATSLLAFFVKYFCNSIPLIIGNILSTIISFYFIDRMEDSKGIGWDGGYFKPFSPSQLLVVVSFLNFIPQYIAMTLANKVRKC
ncbi:hypothetical protein [Neobacillus terrae]|uniref:hypothetical protein n=1 Tax=Neobacillus terrae TaxID=3034837 RepID=UPI00140BD8F3|nr:hypothetical protein [Neobacillus terrae]NHM34072.1 hypothetical protein [Neobacillus terrae]